MIRVLIVDDHAILRDGIRSILESQDDIVVVGEASNGSDALEYISTLLPNIVLMDISMPKTNGLEATRLVKERFPHVKVLILTQHDNREYIAPALGAGASGYVLKRSGRSEMLNAIRQVHEQGAYLTNKITQKILQEYTQPGHSNSDIKQNLTDRECQVLELIVEGKSNKEVALVLNISHKTVSVHRTNIMSKLDVQNTVELIRAASSHPLRKFPATN
ncbi:MAG: response regulator transcription factor [Anaerolineales bacterium]|uniref:Response regulator transcription factor n=1 Tax=Candidatus Desulfolinea nitratireducens TaxID=2841698 RepID=A0A8J6TJP9_9CHLR|nr:response regulator transcription factor [Candidatus Desulfolinea nitratireducens]MBL6959661.1 response regulator transcription factor [Anaerolineales bacterium]